MPRLRQALRDDIVGDVPIDRDWTDLVDLGRFPAPRSSPDWRITSTGFAVRVSQHTTRAGALVATAMYLDLEAALRAVAAEITKHNIDQDWNNSPPVESRNCSASTANGSAIPTKTTHRDGIPRRVSAPLKAIPEIRARPDERGIFSRLRTAQSTPRWRVV
jgi:hypothetical protein